VNSKGLQQLGALASPEVVRAVAELSYLMAFADGVVSPEETDHIAATLHELSACLGGISEVEALVLAWAREHRPLETGGVIRDVARTVTDPAHRRQLLAYAAGIAFADGVLDFEEELVLIALAEAFALPKEEAFALMDRGRGELGTK
jgi:tellurite resistance protein